MSLYKISGVRRKGTRPDYILPSGKVGRSKALTLSSEIIARGTFRNRPYVCPEYQRVPLCLI